MQHPKELDDTSYALDDTEFQVKDCVHEVLMLRLLDEYLQNVDDGGVKMSEKPQDDPPSIPPNKMNGENKGKRSWKL